MFQAEQMQNRGVEVINRLRILDGFVAQIVGGTVNCTALDACASQPHREPIGVFRQAQVSVCRRRRLIPKSVRDLRINHSSTLTERLKSLPQRREVRLRGLEDSISRASLTFLKTLLTFQ